MKKKNKKSKPRRGRFITHMTANTNAQDYYLHFPHSPLMMVAPKELLELKEKVERIEKWIDFWENVETPWKPKSKKRK